jgi:hypothetical protein
MCVGLMGCDQGGWLRDSRGRGGADIMQDGTVDLEYGIGVEGNSNPCIKGLSIGFLHLKVHIKSMYVVWYCINTVYFSPLQIKNNHEGVMNVSLFLGLLERLRTICNVPFFLVVAQTLYKNES